MELILLAFENKAHVRSDAITSEESRVCSKKREKFILFNSLSRYTRLACQIEFTDDCPGWIKRISAIASQCVSSCMRSDRSRTSRDTTEQRVCAFEDV